MATPDVIPGEWFVEERPGTTPVTMVLSRDSDGTRYAVAKVYPHPDGQSDLPTARLLAAAPELLQALEAMVASFAGAMELGDNDLDADGFDYGCMIQAREAIRLAREGR